MGYRSGLNELDEPELQRGGHVYIHACNVGESAELVLSGFDTGFGKGFGEADEVGKLLGSLR